MVTASIVWGLASRRGSCAGAASCRLLELHRYLATLSIVFTAVHLLGLVGDNWVEFGWSELFVPMSSTWQPGNVAWGIAALYVLVAVQITSWMMRWLPRQGVARHPRVEHRDVRLRDDPRLARRDRPHQPPPPVDRAHRRARSCRCSSPTVSGRREQRRRARRSRVAERADAPSGDAVEAPLQPV